MLEMILDRRLLFGLVGAAAVIGIVSKAVVSISLKRLTKAAGNMGKSSHPLMRLVRAKFEHACMVSDKVQNVGVFVEKFLFEYRIFGITLHRWKRLERASAWGCAVFGLLEAGLFYAMDGMSDAVLRSGGIGLALGVGLFLLRALSDEGYRTEMVHTYMVDYLENVCAHRYEKTKGRHEPGATDAWRAEPEMVGAQRQEPGATDAWRLEPGEADARRLEPGMAGVRGSESGAADAWRAEPEMAGARGSELRAANAWRADSEADDVRSAETEMTDARNAETETRSQRGGRKTRRHVVGRRQKPTEEIFDEALVRRDDEDVFSGTLHAFDELFEMDETSTVQNISERERESILKEALQAERKQAEPAKRTEAEKQPEQPKKAESARRSAAARAAKQSEPAAERSHSQKPKEVAIREILEEFLA